MNHTNLVKNLFIVGVNFHIMVFTDQEILTGGYHNKKLIKHFLSKLSE